jgi:hypothetical protein
MSTKGLPASGGSVKENPSPGDEAVLSQPLADGMLLLDADEALFHRISQHHIVLQLLGSGDRDQQLLSLTERTQLAYVGDLPGLQPRIG